jgi:hypothetical protein
MNPLLGSNQRGVARYFVPALGVSGGLIELINHENGQQYLAMAKELTDEEGKIGVYPGWRRFKQLEDVWMTVLCPVHRDAVWFL